MKRLLLGVAVLCMGLLVPQKAAAHVLIHDDMQKVGAVLHITPDDDPVAGKPATLFYDVKDTLFLDNVYRPALQITDDNGKTTDVTATHSGATISTTYTFPAQGVYTLRLLLSSPDKTYTFTYVQRVARGTASSTSAQTQDYAWADMALVASGATLIALAGIAFNHHKSIKQHWKNPKN